MTTKDVPDAPESNPDWMDVPKFISNKPVEPNTYRKKLSTEQVKEIRASTDKIAYLAAAYGVSEFTIGKIKTYQSWKNVRS